MSTGIFLTWLKDEHYAFIDSTVKYRADSSGFTPATGSLRDTTGKVVRKESDSRSKIGLGVLLHAYPRIFGNFNIGLAAGLLTTTEVDLNLLLGVSVLLGSERRFGITGGAIWGKADRLSNTVEEGVNRNMGGVIYPGTERYAKPIFYTSQNNVVPVVRDWKQSWFIGVTWNLTK